MKRFWSKVKKTDSCWLWVGARNEKGYGKIGLNYKTFSAHRISWELKHGKIPNGLFVLHKCDNPPCVNPSHLFLGTNLDNVKDMISKGRNSKPPKMGGWNKKEIPQSIVDRMGKEPDTLLALEIGCNKSVIRRKRKSLNIDCFPCQTRFASGHQNNRWSKRKEDLTCNG